MKNNKLLKTQKGITLVALGIMIIVLMIISGVTLATLTSNHGIINESESAYLQTEIAKLQEITQLYVKNKNINRIKNRDYSNVTMQQDISDVTTQVTTKENLSLGIYQDFKKLNFDSKFGKGGKNITSDWNKSITDLKDAFAIDIITNDIYYITNDKIWNANGNITVSEIQENNKEVVNNPE